MGQPSFEASNALIYCTLGAFLIMGVSVAWFYRDQLKDDFLSSNGTQSAFPLALNFIASESYGHMLALSASALGSGILFAYPELGTITGIQGVLIYALSSGCPMLLFGAIGPIIRRKCPEGFVLTEWTRQRYGTVAMLYLSFMTLVTLFLYMVSELSAVGQVVNLLAGIDGLPVMIVMVAVVTIYTSLGGFRISFITDVFQGTMVLGLVIIAAITIGVNVEIKRELIDESRLLKPTLLGWQLLYILPVAIFTNDFFLAQFWLRTFASRSDRDLRIGVSIATVVLTCLLTLLGCAGLVAVWSGVWPGDPPQLGSVAIFSLFQSLPSWVVGIIIVMVITLSAASFDSQQSAMISTASNDLFRNRLNIWIVRGAVVLVTIPIVVIALKAPSILQIYLISDLLSASTIPVLCLGLSDRFYWWRGFEVVVGGLGGLFTVFLFGTVYYGSAMEGAELLLLQEGLYAGDWSVFGAFVAAPVGSFLWGFGALGLRLGFQWVMAKRQGRRFDALDPPVQMGVDEDRVVDRDDAHLHQETVSSKAAGKFF